MTNTLARIAAANSHLAVDEHTQTQVSATFDCVNADDILESLADCRPLVIESYAVKSLTVRTVNVVHMRRTK